MLRVLENQTDDVRMWLNSECFNEIEAKNVAKIAGTYGEKWREKLWSFQVVLFCFQTERVREIPAV